MCASKVLEVISQAKFSFRNKEALMSEHQRVMLFI
jgi:hypothetical protein